MKLHKTACLFSLVLCAALLFSGCAGIADLSEQPTAGVVETADGKTEWSLDDEGVLTLRGTGEAAAVPVEKEKVRAVVMTSGFYAIGDDAFAEMVRLTRVEIPETVEKIGRNAFRNCTEVARIDLPKATRDIASSAFAGWQDTQKIVSEWYEGNAAYFEEWFAFARQFGDEVDRYLDENEIPEEIEAQLSQWWARWEDSGYWEKAKEIGGKIGSSAVESGESWYRYWSEFGRYLTDDAADKAVPEGKPDWWKDADDIADYLGKRMEKISAEIPAAFRNYYESHKEEIDGLAEKAGELARGLGDRIADALKELFDKDSR